MHTCMMGVCFLRLYIRPCCKIVIIIMKIIMIPVVWDILWPPLFLFAFSIPREACDILHFL